MLVRPDGTVLVVESGAHRLTPVSIADSQATGTRMHTQRTVMELAPGTVILDVIFTAPPGQKLDDSFGEPAWLEVSASPPSLLRSGAGRTADLRRALLIAPDAGEGVLQVVAQAATCDIEGEHPACHLTRQDWGVPIRVTPDGATRLPLVLRGLDT